MSGPSFSAGRDIKGAFATGDNATAVSSHYEATTLDPSIDIAAELSVLRATLIGMPGINTKTLTRLDEAGEEAAKTEPKRGEVQGLLTQAIRYASEAHGLASILGMVEPQLQRIASWLGVPWQQWVDTLTA